MGSHRGVGGSAGGVESGDSGNCPFGSGRKGGPLTAVNGMIANGNCHNPVFLDLEDRPEIAFDVHRVNGAAILGGKAVDFVSAKARVERVFLENRPGTTGGFLLIRWQRIESLPKIVGRSVPVFHFASRGGGGAPLITISMSTMRPASASAMPCLKSSGIHESSCSTTYLVTTARSSGGSALNCSMISVALMPVLKREMPSTASRWSVPPEPPGLRGGVSPSPLPVRGAPFQNGKRREAK